MPHGQTSMLRFFFPATRIWDRPLDYLRVANQLGYRIRSLPIGSFQFGHDYRWLDICHLLTTPMSSPFVNVVCAPLGLSLGVPFVATDDHGRPTVDKGTVYTPQTAFAGLCTVGCPNVAIVMGSIDEAARAELAALAQYDLVICDVEGNATRLRELGIGHAVFAAPTEDALLPILLSMCGPPPAPLKQDITATQKIVMPDAKRPWMMDAIRRLFRRRG